MTFKALIFTIFLVACFAQTASAEDFDSKLLMVSPGDNSFFEIRDKSRYLHFIIKRPNRKHRYKLEIVLNGRKVVDHFITKDNFKIKVGKYDQDVKWKLEAYDKDDNLVSANNYATVRIYHNQQNRSIDLKLDRHSLKNKLIITWKEQDECSGYEVLSNGKLLSRTSKKGAIINEHADVKTIKVACLEDSTHFGKVELKPKKILAHTFLYEFQSKWMNFRQELSSPGLAASSSNQSYLMQVHGLAYQLHWDKRKRNDITTFARYGLPVDFGDDIREFSFEVRMRFDFLSTLREKLLMEFENISLKYDFNDQFASEQTMTFLAAGIESYFNINNKVLKGAFLFKKELQSPSTRPSFKLRFILPYTRKVSWTAEADFNRFTSDLEAGALSGETENHLKQVKAGVLYLF